MKSLNKNTIKNWLKNNINFKNNLNKQELLKLVKENTVYPGYNEPRYNEYLAITNRVSGTGNQ
jgi:hypothetical protein